MLRRSAYCCRDLAQSETLARPSSLSVWSSLEAASCALVAFHFAFSDDWLGPLRPGSGAWKENALDYLQSGTSHCQGTGFMLTDGILNNSPHLLLRAWWGFSTLARLRDRRLVIAAAILYAATAGINGLHTYNWNFGHGFPCRFMVMSALPAAGLRAGLEHCR